MIRFNAPDLRRDFILVVDRDKHDLAAAALSCLYEEGRYLPMFSFGKVDVSIDSEVSEPDIYALQRRHAHIFSTFLFNAIIANGGCDNLVLLGLSNEQKSFLDFTRNYNVLDIETHVELDTYLGGYALDKKAALECSPEQTLLGLCIALRQNRILRIGSFNQSLEQEAYNQAQGIVVIEDYPNSEVVISVNYGFSVGANVHLVQKLEAEETEDILYLLEKWNDGHENALKIIKDKINIRLAEINFNVYEFATFFTEGLPYTLCISNLPVSYINLETRPDFFIYNAFIHEKSGGIGSAVVFSPIFFKDEETNNLISLLEFENYYVRELLANTATNYNLRNTVEHYPFDILHICSHGGDVGGTCCQVDFIDSDGGSHKIEFDHVLSVALTPYQDMHSVESIYYFKSLDGYAWRSDEIRVQNYTHELFASLVGEIRNAFNSKKVIIKGKVNRISNANAIHCIDFDYQAHFDQLGGHKIHPIIFNNTCWSWRNVSTSFLACGARGYIGTLIQVSNNKAARFADVFYENVFNYNIVDAMKFAVDDFKQTATDPLYIFWGVHFSTLSNHSAVLSNKVHVIRNLSVTIATWQNKRGDGKENLDLVAGKLLDTQWILKDVLNSNTMGHRPASQVAKK